MTSGIGFQSFLSEMTLSGSGFLSGYPVTNAADIVRVTNVARSTGAGSPVIAWTGPTLREIQAISLIHHTFGPTDTMRVRLYDGPALSGSLVEDSGDVALWLPNAAAVPGYLSIRPIVFDRRIWSQSGSITFTAAAQAQVGAIDISGWFDLAVGWTRARGLIPRGTIQKLAGGASRVFDSFSPRTVDGQVDRMRLRDSETTAIDFQTINNLRQPFVWVEDIDDPPSWPRTCMLVRNQSLAPIVGASYRRDQFQFHFVEHLR